MSPFSPVHNYLAYGVESRGGAEQFPANPPTNHTGGSHRFDTEADILGLSLVLMQVACFEA